MPEDKPQAAKATSPPGTPESSLTPDSATPPPPEPEPDGPPPPPVQLRANRATQRKWVKQGLMEQHSEEKWIAAGYTYLQQLAEAAAKAKPTKTFEEMVPSQYQEYSKVFLESESEQLPAHQLWDHVIELIPGAPKPTTHGCTVWLMVMNITIQVLGKGIVVSIGFRLCDWITTIGY